MVVRIPAERLIVNQYINTRPPYSLTNDRDFEIVASKKRKLLSFFISFSASAFNSFVTEINSKTVARLFDSTTFYFYVMLRENLPVLGNP
jgi:hypothetical protein